MRARTCLAVVVAALYLGRGPAVGEVAKEVWRSPFGKPRAVSRCAADGTLWVAVGASVLHLDGSGSILSQTNGFCAPAGVSANPVDGSCWVADTNAGQVVHLSSRGEELWRGGELVRPESIAVSAVDGSVWVADTNGCQVVHLDSQGWELARLSGYGEPGGISVDPEDGSCWVAYNAPDQLVRFSAQNVTELQTTWGYIGTAPVYAVAVDPNDHSCWATTCIYGTLGTTYLVHMNHDGTMLWGGLNDARPVSLCVNPFDGSVWVGTSEPPGSPLVHLRADGTELWRGGNVVSARSICPDPTDGSVWVADDWGSVLARFAGDGTELWRTAGFGGPTSIATDPRDDSAWFCDRLGARLFHVAPDSAVLWSQGGIAAEFGGLAVDPRDGSTWLAQNQPWDPDEGEDEVAHRAADGTMIACAAGFTDPTGVAVDPTDGSCWVTLYGDHQVVHLAPDGHEIWRGGDVHTPTEIALSPFDGTLWVLDPGQYWMVVHLAPDGAALGSLPVPGANGLAVNPTDGSVWLSCTSDVVAHYAADGTERSRSGGFSWPLAVAVNAADGSCWASDKHTLTHLAPDGTELWRGAGYLSPGRISINPQTGSVWVADTYNGQVARVVLVGWDVPPGHWAHAEVEACVDAGIVQGYWDGAYRPALPVDRASVAVYIARALAGGDVNVRVPTGVIEPTFADVGEDHWAYEYIEYAAAANVVQGYPGGSYRPTEVVNRGQMAVFIARAMVSPSGDAGLPDPPMDDPTFPDVTLQSDWSWCYQQVEFLASEGIVQGYWDGTYRPEQAVTRGQMAVYIARAFELLI